MYRYVVNDRTDTNPNSNNEVHKVGCPRFPTRDVTELGRHDNCRSAMVEARKHYPHTADGCYHCCELCHVH